MKRAPAILRTVLFLLILSVTYFARYHVIEVRFSTAAARGNAEAQYHLGRSYLTHGGGSRYDPRLAVQLLDSAARQGHAAAAMELGDRLLSGSSMGTDRELAISYYEIAAHAGSGEARRALDALSRRGR